VSNHHDDEQDDTPASKSKAADTGATPEIIEYPKMLYNKDGAQRIVQNAQEAEKLGGDWSDKPPSAKE